MKLTAGKRNGRKPIRSVDDGEKPPLATQLKPIIDLYEGEKITAHHMAQLLHKATGENITARDVFGIYYEFSKRQNDVMHVLTPEGIKEKPISSIMEKPTTTGNASTILMDVGAALEIYNLLPKKDAFLAL